MKTPNNERDKLRSHIPQRLNFLFISIFVLFIILILRLGYMQIVRGDEYQAEVSQNDNTLITNSVARGEIYDANLEKLVGNNAHDTITYTRGRNTESETMVQVAQNLAQIIEMPNVAYYESDTPDITQRDMQDYYYAANQEELQQEVDDYLEANDIDPNDFSYEDSLEFVDEEDLESFDEIDKTATAIYARMNSSYALDTVNIKSEDVSQEEVASVSTNLNSLPGVGTGVDWQRTYPEGQMLRSVLGVVSDAEQGLPQSDLNAYLARGYSRNDRVGTSYLENQYEPVLKGSKSRIEIETDANGEVINQNVQYPGSKGDNLILSTDIDFQAEVEQIAQDALEERIGLNNSIYITALDPSDGDILAMTGQKANEDGEVEDDALGNLSSAFAMGSSVKPATILAGGMDGVLDESNNVMVDEPLEFAGSPEISSVFNRDGSVEVDEQDALKYSSNIYMAKLAMRMGGKTEYTPGENLNMDANRSLETMRYYFKQMGLGSPTGVDLPYESTGQEGQMTNQAEALFQSFGQFDTYTTLQLAQFVSTIANNGTRIAPRFVSEIRGTNEETGGVGPLKTEIDPVVMNTLDVDQGLMDSVQAGMVETLNGDYGFGAAQFRDAPYTAAGKTGTAETLYWGENEDARGEPVYNLTFVAYAPVEDPQIAVATVVPYLPDMNSNLQNVAATRQVMDAFFDVGEYSDSSSDEENGLDNEDSEQNDEASEESESETSEESATEPESSSGEQGSSEENQGAA